MLNDDFAERTLPATARRRREARDRGQVARSPDFTAAVILLAVSGLAWFQAPVAVSGIADYMRLSLSEVPSTSVTSIEKTIFQFIGVTATIVGPIALVVLLSGLLANLAQTGWLWATEAAIPQLRWGSLFSSGQIARTIGHVVQIAALLFVGWRFVIMHENQIRSISLLHPQSLLVGPASLLGEFVIQLSVTLIGLAIVDFGVRYWINEQRLKMTVEEYRNEQRNESVDPRIKRRQKQRANHHSAMNPVGSIEPVSSPQSP